MDEFLLSKHLDLSRDNYTNKSKIKSDLITKQKKTY